MTYHYQGDIWLKKLEVGTYGNNCYIVIDPASKQSAIIDAPAEPERILEAVAGTEVRFLLITHTHRDHLGAFDEIVAATNASVGVHAAEADKLPKPPDFSFTDGDALAIGGVSLGVLHVPGHTPGSSSFVTGRHLFTGDTLFPGGPGRSATAEDLQQELRSISTQLLTLPPETAVYPGHGADTTISTAREEYAAFTAKPHADDLHGDVLWLTS